jgi:hypothetical protein
MTIIDSQVHAYEANTPKRPWHSVPNRPAAARQNRSRKSGPWEIHPSLSIDPHVQICGSRILDRDCRRQSGVNICG